MKAIRAAAAAGLALALMAGAAHATTFDYTGGFQSFTAPTAGVYDITASGAQGGTAYQATYAGGLGAQVGGDFTLTQGEMLTILVGGMGGYGGQDNNGVFPPPSGGGGGGSFVYTTVLGPLVLQAPPLPEFPVPGTVGYVPLAIAGGGGGAAVDQGSGTAPTGGYGYTGGSFLGNSADTSGGPGASFYFPGGNNGGGMPPDLGGQGGVISPLDVLYGPNADGHGGFGGGGGGGQGEEAVSGFGGGGGGGGYDGGDGGIVAGGGGGYSFLADGTPKNADYLGLSGVQSGDGLVTISLVSAVSAAPEPSTWLLIMAGIGGIGLMLRRKKPEGGALAGAAAI